MGLGTDPQILIDILKYKETFNYPVLVETGTYQGTSSKIFSSHFEKVYTCDISDDEKLTRRINFKNKTNIEFILGESKECLPKFFNEIGNDNFFLFCDAHWQGNYPILDELQIVADFGYKPFIFIHDFHCGHDNWGFDSWGNIILDYNYVKPKMDLIYGEDNYIFEVSQISQNEPDGFGNPNLRGCGFFYPKN
jgi:hypothetical protein